jgi:hypothetical protein
MKTKFNGSSEPIRKLRHLRQYFPSAILAGGALREDYMDKFDEINDYDFFIKSPTDHASKTAEEIIEKVIHIVFPNPLDVEVLLDSAYLTKEESESDERSPGALAEITSVWDVIDNDGENYQLIFSKQNPIQHVENHFDIGLCKTYCDGKKIHYSDDFLTDVKNRTMTIVGKNMTKEQVEYAVFYHADRLEWKYDFRIVLPQQYQHYIPDTFSAF